MTVSLGDPPDYVSGPVTRTDLVRYAGASGDFNPLHHDENFARAAGLPSVMAHGMYSAGLLGSFVAAWAGERDVRRFKVRFRSPVWPGDTLRAVGELSATEERAGGTVAVVKLALRRENGDEVVSGDAEIWLTREEERGQ